MLNEKLRINKKILENDFEKKPIRDGFGEGLVAAGEENKNVVALCADLMESTRTEAFAKKFPERFFEVGVAEQNMATIAAGLGISGKIPFISSYAIFSPGRNYEQIRTTICYNDSNVKIVGAHAGISVGPDGATHQATEDIAVMRALPNMKVVVPCDALEAKKATIAAAKVWGPVYIRLGRAKSAVVTTEETPFRFGKAELLWHPTHGRQITKPDVLIVGCGTLIHNSILAAKELESDKINVSVLNVHTIKPLDEHAILNHAGRAVAVVVVEEHQIAGGLGGAVAELLARALPMPMEFIGIRDTFGESGQPRELIEKYGMGVGDIKEAVRKAMKRKGIV
ncbi:transketolase [Candidatus Jorgensenbacteria bacterium RIFCSPLOWO2_02_FULL_45_12]|uniref:Transketolase n=2 Tax=Candidatus Joergenseniibacteriota TaxID=1752739 RepID=A0A1F6BML5_9BACT|nr:MAG: hypothetical protein UX22_C0005G0013 [Candidatus Jorgensenbacteria bacterium GW2011_GWA2_45_9]OGG38166.1 MAG: transketolase [Candidatus Jorgensenbacteria bacterium RIFCSPHIGHO2_02_FULL_45_20]OGG42556.1 MAG: transketolase [Candidatus Jorgensenbacteria bacterium RIFCSPLOWO2_02_FULL_45_12]